MGCAVKNMYVLTDMKYVFIRNIRIIGNNGDILEEMKDIFQNLAPHTANFIFKIITNQGDLTHCAPVRGFKIRITEKKFIPK